MHIEFDTEVVSSNIRRIAYSSDVTDANQKFEGFPQRSFDLFVLFNNDAIYVYREVAPETAEEFYHAESCGSYLAKNIAKNHKYECLREGAKKEKA